MSLDILPEYMINRISVTKYENSNNQILYITKSVKAKRFIRNISYSLMFRI